MMSSADWANLLNEFRGLWVALADDQTTVIAAAETARDAVARSAQRGVPSPFLFYVPETFDVQATTLAVIR